ncbi:hypothetical protein [Spirosoma aerophilum]
MTSTSFETTLYQQLTPFFERHQFLLMPEKKQYRKITETGFQLVMLSPAYSDDEITLDIRFGCRNEQVEQIAQQFLSSQASSQQDANTILISISQFSEYTSVRFRIHCEEELLLVCKQIEQFFDSRGLDFITASSTLTALDRLLNGKPEQACPYVYNQIHRFYKGLISASLNHNRQFNSLIDRYRQLLIQQTQNRYELIRFERLIAFLQHYSPN